jgi:hypothetical protein
MGNNKYSFRKRMESPIKITETTYQSIKWQESMSNPI